MKICIKKSQMQLVGHGQILKQDLGVFLAKECLRIFNLSLRSQV